MHPQCSVVQLNQILNDLPLTANSPTFNFRPITFDETQSFFKKALLKSKGNSPDSIKLKYLSSVIPYISSFFSIFYNSLLSSQSYPSLWKRSFIVPLLKKPKPDSVNDVRPITNICHCAKPLDSLIASQLSTYFESNNFYSTASQVTELA